MTVLGALSKDEWLLPLGVKPPIIKARKRMYDRLLEIHRRRSVVHQRIFEELERQGIGGDREWSYRWHAIEKEQNNLIEKWERAEIGTKPPEPQTPLEDDLQAHHRLRWEEWDLCDEIEKVWGAVSPWYDSRHQCDRRSNRLADQVDTPRAQT
jgi:hypothetical protein